MLEGKASRCDRKRLEIFLQWPQVDRILFSGQKAAGPKPTARGKQALNVTFVIGMVVAKFGFCRRRDSGGAHLGEELLRPRDTAADNRCAGRARAPPLL